MSLLSGKEPAEPARCYAAGDEAQALSRHLDCLQTVAVNMAGHLISVRMKDCCDGNIATARVPISPGQSARPPPLSEVEESMLDLVVGSAGLLARFRATRRNTGFALNDEIFVNILSRCERMQDVILAHKDVCLLGHAGNGVPYPEQVGTNV